MKYDSLKYLEDKSIDWLEKRLKEDCDKELHKELSRTLIEKVENSSESISLSIIIKALNYYNMQEVLEKREHSPNSFIALAAHINMLNRMSNTKHAELFDNREAFRQCKKVKKKIKKGDRYNVKY